MSLTECTFIMDGNSNYVKPENLPNFEKRKILAMDIAQPLGEHQKIKYNFTPVEELQAMIKSVETLSEDELMAKSCEIIPKKQLIKK